MSNNDPKLESARKWIDLALPQLGGRITFRRQTKGGAVRFDVFPCATLAWGVDRPISATPFEHLTKDQTGSGAHGGNEYYQDRYLRRRRTLAVELYSQEGEAFDLSAELRMSLRRPEILALMKTEEIGLLLISDAIDESGLLDTNWEDTVAIDFALSYLTTERSGVPSVDSVDFTIDGEPGHVDPAP